MKGAHRAGDVLDALFAEILEVDRKLVANLIAGGARDADAAGPGQCFEPRGDVDAVAEDVLALDDHVAHVDADAELEPALLGNARVAPGHGVLDLDRALHGIDDAGELGQEAIAHGLDDAPVTGRDHRLDQLAKMGLEGAERARFVGPHQPRVADHVGGQDRRQPARLVRLIHDTLRGQLPACKHYERRRAESM